MPPPLPIADIGIDAKLQDMEPLSAVRHKTWRGIAALIAFGVGGLMFGFHIVAQFCLLAMPVMIAAGALKKGMFPFVFGRHDLVRATDPRGFWAAIAVSALVAGAQLWLFVDVLLGTTRN